MNKQKVYDRIAKHLLKQNAKSIFEPSNEYGDPPTCAYREFDPVAKKVRKCAVGCLIPFRNYRYDFEGTDVFSKKIAESFPPSLGIDASAGSEDLSFLSKLQSIHDDQPVTGWRQSLKAFAYREDLDPSILETL